MKVVAQAFKSDEVHLTLRDILRLLRHGKLISNKGIDIYLWKKAA